METLSTPQDNEKIKVFIITLFKVIIAFCPVIAIYPTIHTIFRHPQFNIIPDSTLQMGLRENIIGYTERFTIYNTGNEIGVITKVEESFSPKGILGTPAYFIATFDSLSTMSSFASFSPIDIKGEESVTVKLLFTKILWPTNKTDLVTKYGKHNTDNLNNNGSSQQIYNDNTIERGTYDLIISIYIDGNTKPLLLKALVTIDSSDVTKLSKRKSRIKKEPTGFIPIVTIEFIPIN